MLYTGHTTSCRQHFITRRKARFDNRATQTARTARH